MPYMAEVFRIAYMMEVRNNTVIISKANFRKIKGLLAGLCQEAPKHSKVPYIEARKVYSLRRGTACTQGQGVATYKRCSKL